MDACRNYLGEAAGDVIAVGFGTGVGVGLGVVGLGDAKLAGVGDTPVIFVS